MENQSEIKLESKNLELENDGLVYLKEIRKWTNFLSILGFVMLGLMLLVILIVIPASKPALIGRFEWLAFIPVLLITFIYFFPIYYLYMFSRYSKQSLINSDASLMTIALKYLKMHYRFMGIMIIVILSIYVIVLLVMLSMGSFMDLF